MKMQKINNALLIQDGATNYILVKKAPKNYFCIEVTKTNNDKWITVKPHGEEEKRRHLKLEGDETPKEAMKRQWGVDVDKKRHETTVKPEARKKSDEHYSKYKDVQKKEKEANDAWLEETLKEISNVKISIR
ncbi:MAG: hypothetical protein IJI42_02695 [Methanobrevibacter sp.]|nr:hypothetical protein [Methanobrevibacter sp.]